MTCAADVIVLPFRNGQHIVDYAAAIKPKTVCMRVLFSIAAVHEELSAAPGTPILSSREKEVLALARRLKREEIAERLNTLLDCAHPHSNIYQSSSIRRRAIKKAGEIIGKR
jgi:hypothetical protein